MAVEVEEEVEDVAWEGSPDTMEHIVARHMHGEHGRSYGGCDIPYTQGGSACY